MASLKYYNPTTETYDYVGVSGVDGKTPYIDDTTKHWIIDDVDTGVKATFEHDVTETTDTISLTFDDTTYTVNKAYNQVIGLSITDLWTGSLSTTGTESLSDSVESYDYIIVEFTNEFGHVSNINVFDYTGTYQMQSYSIDTTGASTEVSPIIGLISFSTNTFTTTLMSGVTVVSVKGVTGTYDEDALALSQEILGI